jgi:pyruvate/2-oxoglutarate dehydrogenase complex dihydrolipoamide acyltransferase (E2) component
MASATQQLRERVTFETNTPREITIDGHGTPTETESQYDGTQFRYFLDGHQICWVPPAVHLLMRKANAGMDATFAITKHRAPKPWTVVHLEDGADTAREPEPQPAKKAPTAAPAAAPQQPAATTTPALEPLSKQAAEMLACLQDAIRVASRAQQFAREHAHPLNFSTENVRSLAASLFIRAEKAGRA